MAEEVNNIIEEENTSQVNSEDDVLTEEQVKEEEAILEEAVAKLNSYGLEWNFRSIEYVINKENIGFAQLRSCVYNKSGMAVFDYVKSTSLLIKAGLVGSKQFKESDVKALDDKAFEIMEDWRSEFGYLGTLHLLIINQMETKHFFMGTKDQAVVSRLGSKNLQRDLARNLLREDLEQKVQQARALN